MILPIHARIRARLQDTLVSAFGIAPADLPSISLEVPPKRALGDVAVPVAFELARRLKKAPRTIGAELASALGSIDGVARVEVAPNGYLNFYLDRPAFLRARLSGAVAPLPPADSAKVIVEHTAINPNKAAHIGHLRNATLGDTLVRLLRFQGRAVEVQNYIDDTGVQVADVVVGFRELEQRDLASVKALAETARFDYYCWDLYAKVTEWYGEDKARLAKRADALHAIEAGGNDIAEMGAFIADRIVRSHLKTMKRLNVDYDLLTWEGDILRLHFWATAFEDLKRRNAVFMQTDGKLKGCWVMKIEDPDDPEPVEGDDHDEAAGAADGDARREKVIVRSNGVVTYVGKDIANQFWKFGILGRDFLYRAFTKIDGRTLWATTSNASAATAGAPSFGKAGAVYNVIDSRQAYLQKLLKQALATMGFEKEAAASTHFAYEMVALSHATARELGYDVDPDGKPFVEVSGRKGLGVKADDLIDRLTATALVEVAKRNPELSDAEARRTAEAIAVAAIRYFLVKFTRGKVIAFDIAEALSFEGETGPYLQYAIVRGGNIFAKLKERDGIDEASVAAAIATAGTAAIESGDEGDELWNLVLEASRLDEAVDTSVRSLELSVIAKFAFSLAQSFNAFYHRQPILKEERADVRVWRAAAVAYVRRQLTQALGLMGCDAPARM
jgi:arginyl-tRNA synthetase